MQKKVAKIFGILVLIEALLFFGVILTSMSDDAPALYSRYFYITLKYVFGFPLVIINSAFPFFLDSYEFHISAIFMTILNNLILAFGIYQILNIFSKRRNHRTQ